MDRGRPRIGELQSRGRRRGQRQALVDEMDGDHYGSLRAQRWNIGRRRTPCESPHSGWSRNTLSGSSCVSAASRDNRTTQMTRWNRISEPGVEQ
jgi:hypothetical protein